MPRQPFDQFLQPAGSGPSTPRGRGGRGGFRGGRGGTPGSGNHKSDYSNVPFDYEGINRQGYVKLEGKWHSLLSHMYD